MLFLLYLDPSGKEMSRERTLIMIFRYHLFYGKLLFGA